MKPLSTFCGDDAVDKHHTSPCNELNFIIVLSTTGEFAEIICLRNDLKLYYVSVRNANRTLLAADIMLAEGIL